MREFELVGWCDKDGNFNDSMQQLVCNNILEVLDLWAEHNYSGASHPYALSLFNKMVNFKTIGPLTGDDSEWLEEAILGSAQNKRFSSVFKDDKTGRAYRTDAIVFKERHGGSFTSSNSFRWIKFPYDTSTKAKVYPAWLNRPMYWLNNFLNFIRLPLLRPLRDKEVIS